MSGIGFHEAREMWIPKLIDILYEKEGVRSVTQANLTYFDESEGGYPRYLSKIREPETGRYILCVPPGYGYALIREGDPRVWYNVRFYKTDGTYDERPLPYQYLPYYTDYGESFVGVVTTTYGPTRAGFEYYINFGLDRVEIPADCTRLTAIMPRAIELFNERYAYRMLNSETLEQWQMRLQHTADLNVYRYERALELYATNAEEMLNVLEKTVTVRDATTANSGTDSTTYGRTDTYAGTVKNVDTPDSAVNDSDDYADSVTRNNNSNTASGTDRLTHGLRTDIDDTVTETKEPVGGIVRATNDSIDAYRDLVADFVKEFENNFLNVFWY